MKHQMTEDWLDERALKWEYATGIPVSDIILDAETLFNIRLTTEVNDDLVLQYGVALETGAKFPAVTLFKKNGQFGIIDGVHRIHAFQLAERETTDAYVVTLDPDDNKHVQMLRRTANVNNGDRPSLETNVRHAVWLVQGHGYTPTDAAKLMKVPNDKVEYELRIQQTLEDLSKSGVPIDDPAFPRTTLTVLYTLRGRPDMQRRLAELYRSARLGTETLRDLSMQIRGASSDEAANRILDEAEEEYRPAMQKTVSGLTQGPRSPYQKLPAALTRAERIMAETDTDSMQALNVEQMLSLATHCRETAKELTVTARRLEKAAKVG